MKEILTYGFKFLRSIVNGLLNFLCEKPSRDFLASKCYKPLGKIFGTFSFVQF